MKKLLFVALLAFASIASAQQTYRELQVISTGARVASAAGVATDINPSSVNFLEFRGLLVIDVTAASGSTPTMRITAACQTARTGSIHVISTSAADIITTGQYFLDVPYLCKTMRFGYNIGGGTPSFTFSADLIRQ